MPIVIEDVAQLLVGVAAIAALYLGPALGFKNSRRLAVAASRQNWLDGLRADVAKIIALHGELVAHYAKQTAITNAATDPSGLLREVGELTARVRMRLNMGEPLHVNLNEEVAKFITNYKEANPNKLISAMDPIVAEVWSDIKSGRI